MPTQSANCPAIFLAAPASGEGKTTITAALARYHKNQGRQVRVFKTGPDYLDPMILEAASAAPVEQLDLWMAGADYCRQQLFLAAQEADLIIVEGAMGLFDGEPSSADLAQLFGIPIALVINAKGMAQTVAALCQGLVNFRPGLSFAGLITNSVSSTRHKQLIAEALADDIEYLAALPRAPEVTLPERHLGLVQAHEYADLHERLDAGAAWVAKAQLNHLPQTVTFHEQAVETPQALLKNLRIAIAKDDAFSFIYAANLRLLDAMGAEIIFFSPLHDRALPEADALWLPGGYPELHNHVLANNTLMLDAIRSFYQSGKPILAECGGMMYCMQTLTNLEEQAVAMLGLIPGHAAMRGRSGCQGMQSAILPEGEIRAHAHHRSVATDTAEPIAYGQRQRHDAPGEAIYRNKGLTASYLHLFFPSNPEAIAKLFTAQLLA